MKIAINALPFRNGGGLTYLQGLLRHRPAGADIQVTIFAAPEAAPHLRFPGVDVHAVPWATQTLWRRLLWERTVFSRFLRTWSADLVFCPGGILNAFVPSKCKTAIVLQNMLPFAKEEIRRYARCRTRMRFHLLRRAMLRSIAQADLTIYLTQYARQSIGPLVPNTAARALVIPHAIASEIVTNVSDPAPIAEPYILYVSSFHPYKAHQDVVRAYAVLRRMRPTKERLVFVGGGDPQCIADITKEIVRHGLEEWVCLVDHVSQAALARYYGCAKVILFASRCEMFPFILLESMGAGRPVLVADHPPMPEVAADAPVYFHPDDPDDLAGKLTSILDDEAQLQRLGRRAAARAQLFSWERTAIDTWTALQRHGRSAECVEAV